MGTEIKEMDDSSPSSTPEARSRRSRRRIGMSMVYLKNDYRTHASILRTPPGCLPFTRYATWILKYSKYLGKYIGSCAIIMFERLTISPATAIKFKLAKPSFRQDSVSQRPLKVNLESFNALSPGGQALEILSYIPIGDSADLYPRTRTPKHGPSLPGTDKLLI